MNLNIQHLPTVTGYFSYIWEITLNTIITFRISNGNGMKYMCTAVYDFRIVFLQRIDAALLILVHSKVIPPRGWASWLALAEIDARCILHTSCGCAVCLCCSLRCPRESLTDRMFHRLLSHTLIVVYVVGRLHCCYRLLRRWSETGPRRCRWSVAPAVSATKNLAQVWHAHGSRDAKDAFTVTGISIVLLKSTENFRLIYFKMFEQTMRFSHLSTFRVECCGAGYSVRSGIAK